MIDFSEGPIEESLSSLASQGRSAGSSSGRSLRHHTIWASRASSPAASAAYRRELPRLLAEGEAGRFALFKGDELLSIWDTQRDATQAGRERFGLEPIAVIKIDPRDPTRFAIMDRQQAQREEQAACPK